MATKRATKGPSKWLQKITKGLSELPELYRLETITMGDVWGLKEHVNQTHELIHVVEGKARITIGSRVFEVRSGDTILLPKGTPHLDVREADTNYRVIYAFFYWPAGAPLLKKQMPLRPASHSATVKLQLKMLFNELESEYLDNRSESEGHVRLIILEIIMLLLRRSHRETGPKKTIPKRSRVKQEQLVKEVQLYLEQNYHEEIGLQDLAKQHGVSSYHLCRTFAQIHGISMSDLLTRIRIDKAKELLRSSRITIKEVATEVGFSNANYFAKVFRRQTNTSPSEYQSRRLKSR